MGESARQLASAPVAAPPSTHANSNAVRASARFFGPAMNPPSSGSMKAAVMPALVVGFQQLVLARRPFVRIALALGHQAGNYRARHRARGLHQHLQVVAVGKAPENLANIVARKGAQSFGFRLCGGTGHIG